MNKKYYLLLIALITTSIVAQEFDKSKLRIRNGSVEAILEQYSEINGQVEVKTLKGMLYISSLNKIDEPILFRADNTRKFLKYQKESALKIISTNDILLFESDKAKELALAEQERVLREKMENFQGTLEKEKTEKEKKESECESKKAILVGIVPHYNDFYNITKGIEADFEKECYTTVSIFKMQRYFAEIGYKNDRPLTELEVLGMGKALNLDMVIYGFVSTKTVETPEMPPSVEVFSASRPESYTGDNAFLKYLNKQQKKKAEDEEEFFRIKRELQRKKTYDKLKAEAGTFVIISNYIIFPKSEDIKELYTDLVIKKL